MSMEPKIKKTDNPCQPLVIDWGELVTGRKKRNLKCGIYRITNGVDGKTYIGQSRVIQNRLCGHLYQLRTQQHGNPHLCRAFALNPESFTVGIVEECLPEQLNDRELFWIKHYNSTNPDFGYNIKEGGNVPGSMAESTRAKISALHKGKKLSQAHREAIGRGITGRHPSEETRRKQRERQLGRPPPLAARIAVAKANRERVWRPETLIKMGDAHRGRHYHTPEFKARLAEYNRTRVLSPETLRLMAEGARLGRERRRLKRMGNQPELFKESA